MTATTEPSSGIGDVLADRASRDPAATALVCGRDRLSYAELAARSDEVAARLAARGAGPESRVGLLVERGVDMVVAVFGVLRAGAAYVPLEPEHPQRHRASLLADAGVTLVLTEPGLAGGLPPGCVPVFVTDSGAGAPDGGAGISPGCGAGGEIGGTQPDCMPATAAPGHSDSAGIPPGSVASGETGATRSDCVPPTSSPASAAPGGSAGTSPDSVASGETGATRPNCVPPSSIPAPAAPGGSAGTPPDSVASGETGATRPNCVPPTSTPAPVAPGGSTGTPPDSVASGDTGATRPDTTTPPRPRTRPDNLAYVLYTSGSTGRPRGVLGTHRGLRRLFAAHRVALFEPAARAAGGRRLRVAHTAPLSFDASWVPLLWMLDGHELHVLDRRDPRATVAALAAARVDVLDETPSYLRVLLLAGLLDGPGRPRVVLAGGEPVDPELGAALAAAGVTVHNVYGTTETTVDSLLCPARTEGPPVLGRPVAGTRAQVLDAGLRPAAEGELCLSGDGLARGYLGRPGATAAAFVADPAGPPGSRMYRTGDRVRRRDDGLLDFLGRADGQVKIRGIRVDPAEAEAALLSHPELAAAAVVARRDGRDADHLVAYVVPVTAPAPPPARLRAFLRGRVPEHLVPARFVELAALPLTGRGKLDRRALPEPAGPAETVTAPRNPAEELVAGIWREALGVPHVGVSDDFVELGGDSILAMRVAGTLNRRWGTALPAQAVFEHRTVAGLAAALPAAHTGRAPARTTPGTALSSGQERLWFLDQLSPGGAEYNTSAGYRLRGPLSLDALSAALTALAERHESLRTTFPTVRGRGVQVVGPPREVRPDVRAAGDIERDLLAEVQRPFDLARGPLFRATVFELGEDDHLLVLVLHHIVTDGWSMGVLAVELGRLYSDAAAELPPLPLRYADFAAWQRDRLAGSEPDDRIAYWERQLSGVPALELPTDRPRPAVRGTAGATHRFTVPAATTTRLAALGRERGATLFMTLIAAAQVLFARYTGQRDVALGTVTAGRSWDELAGLVGFFVNTVVIRSRLDGDPSFADFLAGVRSTVLDAMAHDDVPFGRLVELLAPDRDASRSPLVNVMVVLQNAPSAVPELSGLVVEELDLPRRSAQFDLTVEFEPRDGGLRTTVEYSTELFEPGTIRRLAENLLTLLTGIADDPGRRLSRLTFPAPGQRRELLAVGRSTAEGPGLTVPDVFAERVRERPDAVAVTCAGTALTYRELDTCADRLARRLSAHGADPDVRIGLCVPRGIDAVVGMLAVLKAGGAYVPLDPRYPDERLALLLADSGAAVVLTTPEVRDRVPRGARVLTLDDGWEPDRPGDSPVSRARPGNLACVLYTSGSSGRPKGVLIEHRSVTRLCADPYARLGPDDVSTQYAPLSFDASTLEIWGALLSGARLAIDSEDVPSVEALGAFARAEGVTALWLTAGMFHEVAAADPGVFAGLRRLVSGGDVLSPQQCATVLRRWPELELVNGYGPTEGTTFTACHRVRAADGGRPVPIGRPITGTRCLVLDRNLDPVPAGVPGELYIGGSGLARGYLDRPGLTADRFVADPFGDGTRLYRTGDVVRWRAGEEWVLDFLGRSDDQVKIRGFRIEVGEVEAALRRHPDVAEAVVLAREDTPGHKRLAGYVVPRRPVEAGVLREFLGQSLPGHLVPGALVLLDRFPLTPQGKIDRRALPAPRPGTARARTAPRGPAEELVTRVWAEVLGVEHVGAADNFFELGGDSILGIQVVARARQLGLRLSAKDVFLRQTPAELAAAGVWAEPAAREAPRPSGPVPLSPVQHWFFATITEHPGHFTQWVSAELAADTDLTVLRTAVEALVRHHDALRLRFRHVGGEWRQEYAETVPDTVFRVGPVSTMDFFELDGGALFTAVADGSRLLLAAHHLVVDGVSWRILLADLRTAYRAARAGRPVELPPRTTSFGEWSRRLAAHVAAGGFDDQLAFWNRAIDGAEAPPDGRPGPQRTVTVRLDAGETGALLRDAPAAYRTRIDDLLVSALGRVLAGWTGHDRVVLELEGHGREEIFGDVDLSRTVGWFTTLYPCPVQIPRDGGWGAVLKSVKESLRAAPDRGLGYGALRYLGETPLGAPRPVVAFNYLGRFDLADGEGYGTAIIAEAGRRDAVASAGGGPDGVAGAQRPHALAPAGEPDAVPGAGRPDTAAPAGELFRSAPSAIGLSRAPHLTGTARLDVTAAVTAAGELEFEWTYSPGAHEPGTVARLADGVLAAVREITAHCTEPGAGGRTPSDFPLAAATQAELDRLLGDGRAVEDVYPLTPMQAGMLFHSLSEPGTYLEQVSFTLSGADDPAALERAWRRAVEEIPALRTAVRWTGVREPVQVVHRSVTLPVTVHDWRQRSDPDAAFRQLLAADRDAGLDPAVAPLMRVALIRLAGARIRLLWTFHHVILDGWSVFEVLTDVLAHLSGRPAKRRRPFADHLAWLARQDAAAAETHWRKVLSGLTPTRLPFDRPPGRAHRTRSTSTVERTLSAVDSARLAAFARRHRLTVNAVVQGSWARLLARHGGDPDVCFGAVVSGRPAELPGVDAIVGMFVNTVPVRVTVAEGEDRPGWFRRLQADQAEARRFGHVSLAALRRWSGLPARTSLFDSIVVFENYPFDRDSLAERGLHVAELTAVEITNYPLALVAHGSARDDEPLTLQLGYDPALFDPGTAEALAVELADLLREPARPAVLPPRDRPPAPPAPAGTDAAYLAPRTATERTLSRIWAEVLAVERVGVDDDFFALGGDSLLCLRVTARLRADFGAALPPRALFDNPTVGALALMLEHPTLEALGRAVDRGLNPPKDYEL
ncbi:amino acid adenylation domain-containing protein [Amycolatopsis sp. A133]|uniref:non-ribosomal peptide synthetase n=1 Tax=Amycolatopsis sp. A133 TaxID=3064472 RepID=UPI0027F4FAAD|nr:non-ribosomal peptide synthetase [Amycolatopsis sp. A133]MDQ7808842.1 amino acid adenylation domain-containing protein [Amycolatopsis sp. A133]